MDTTPSHSSLTPTSHPKAIINPLMKAFLALLTALVLLLVLSWVFISTGYLHPSPNPTPPLSASPAAGKILFPTNTDTLIAGQTTTVRWTPGSGTTQIFLIDTSLESQGASVSIVDRIYNIPNSGSYSYTVPESLAAGAYKLTIGTLTSDTFQISSQTSPTTSTSQACKSENLKGSISTEGAAGNIYGTLSLKNTSSISCTIAGSETINAKFDSSVKNLKVQEVKTEGNELADTFSLKPGQTVYSQIHYPNGPQCSNGITTTNVTLTYPISPLQNVTFTPLNDPMPLGVTTCKDKSEMTTLQVWALSSKPISQ
jgi:hypothetical protein